MRWMIVLSVLFSAVVQAQESTLVLVGRPGVTLNDEVLKGVTATPYNLVPSDKVCFERQTTAQDRVEVYPAGQPVNYLPPEGCYTVAPEQTFFQRLGAYLSLTRTGEIVDGKGALRGDGANHDVVLPSSVPLITLSLWFTSRTADSYVIVRSGGKERRFEVAQSEPGEEGTTDVLFEIPLEVLHGADDLGFFEAGRGILYCGDILVTNTRSDLLGLLRKNDPAYFPAIYSRLTQNAQAQTLLGGRLNVLKSAMLAGFNTCPLE